MTTKYIWQRAIINRHQKCWWHDNNLYRNTHTVANKTTPTHMAKQIPTLNPRDMHMLGRILHDARTCLHVLLLLLLLLSSSSSLCSIFTIIYLKQTMFVGHTVLQLFCNLQFVLHVMLFSMLNILYFYSGTFQSIIIIIVPQQVSGIFNALNLSRFWCLILPLL